MFSQELLTNGELNHFSLKERMVEIGKRWHKLSQSQKDKYKKLVEQQQLEYKADLEVWVKVGGRGQPGLRFWTLGLVGGNHFCFALSLSFPPCSLSLAVPLSPGASRLQGVFHHGES